MTPPLQRQDARVPVPTTALKAITSSIDPSRPVYMLNLLRFRDTATYSPGDPEAFQNLPKCSGREAFHTRYVPAFSRVLAEEGIESQHEDERAIVLWGKALATMLGSEGRNEASKKKGTREWDDVALIRYESYEKFLQFVGGRYLTEAVPHRVAGLEGWELIVAQGYDVEGGKKEKSGVDGQSEGKGILKGNLEKGDAPWTRWF